MQAIVHQISHQAAAMAAAASANHSAQAMSGPGTTPGAEGTAYPQPPHPAQARVVITRPSFSPRVPQPVDTRGTTINLRATVPTAGQQPGQVARADLATFVFIINVKIIFFFLDSFISCLVNITLKKKFEMAIQISFCPILCLTNSPKKNIYKNVFLLLIVFLTYKC